MDVTARDVLPPDYALHWYRIQRVLGQGGFGITYLAHDANLDHHVAIKEYLPVEFAVRANNYTVAPRSAARGPDFEWGLERFISEARTLSKFDHRSIVRVHSVFEHNGTAYMVMRYERGESLEAILERRKTLEEEELRRVLLPILDGLGQVHASGFIHRDIKPANIYVREDGSPVLLDFGAAREALGRSKTVTILVAPGYAPFEQYHARGESQGPWTDIYSLGATLYRGIASVAPIDAIERSRGILGSTRDVLVPASLIGKGRYSERFLRAIDHALTFDERGRPQSIDAWLEELEETLPAQEPAAVSESPEPETEACDADAGPPKGPSALTAYDERAVRLRRFGWRWAAGVLAGAGLGLALSLLLPARDESAEAPAGETTPDAPAPLSAERAQLDAEIEALEARRQAAREEVEANEARIAAVNAEARRAEAALATVESEVTASRAELEEARTEVDSAHAEAHSARVELGRLTAEVDDAHLALSTLEERLGARRSELSAGEAELLRLQESRAALAADIARKEAELEGAAAASDEHAAARETLRAEIAALENRSAELRSVAEAELEVRLEALEDEEAGLARSLAEREREYAAAQTAYEALEKRRAALEAEVTTLVRRRETEERRLADLVRAPSAAESERAPPGEPMREDLTKAMAAIEAGDFRLALAELKPLAEQCVTEAQLRLAELYLQGLAASKPDPFKSYLWYRAAQPQAGDAVGAGLAAAANKLQSVQVTQAEKLARAVIAKCP